MGYVDIHNHILWNLDDGCRTERDSMELALAMHSIGFDAIAATPHIWPQTFSEVSAVRGRFEETKAALEKKPFNMELVLAGEHYLDGTFWELLEQGEIIPFPGGKYLLVEFPLGRIPYDPHRVIFELQTKGYKPVLAHAERYDFLKSDFGKLETLANSGLIIQCDICSIIGRYGGHSQTYFSKLLKQDLVHILATDAHGPEDIDDITNSLERIEKLVSPARFEELMSHNPRKIITNAPF